MTFASIDPIKWAAARGLLVTDKLESALATLHAVGVYPLVLLGPSQSGSIDEQSAASTPDIAVLLRPGSARRGRRELSFHGWELQTFFPGGSSLLRDGVTLNLHWGLRSGRGIRDLRLQRAISASVSDRAPALGSPPSWATALLVAAHPHGFALAPEYRITLARTGVQQYQGPLDLLELASRIGIADELNDLIQGVTPVEVAPRGSVRLLLGRLGALSRRLRMRVADSPLHPFSTEFRGMRIGLGPMVFHPQPSAEKMVEVAISLLVDSPSPIVVDVGTGSGAVGLALARSRRDLKVYATDVSLAAVHTARKNRRRLGLANFEVRRGSLLEPVTDLNGRVDAITSVLPYLPTSTAAKALEMAPRVATDGGSDDGLGLMRMLARQAATALRPGGRLIFQLAEGQWDCFAQDLESAGYADPELLVRWPGLVVLGTAQWPSGSNLASSV